MGWTRIRGSDFDSAGVKTTNPMSNPLKTFTAFSGGAWDFENNRMLFHGQGHGDGSGNEIYSFEPFFVDSVTGEYGRWQLLQDASSKCGIHSKNFPSGPPGNFWGFRLYFDNGSSQINPGDPLLGEDSSISITVGAVDLISGSWIDGDAAGIIFTDDDVRSYLNNETLSVGGIPRAIAATVGAAHGVLSVINFDEGPGETTNGVELLTDNSPNARHTYGSLVFIPSTAFADGKGRMLFGSGSLAGGAGSFGLDMWTYNLSDLVWEFHGRNHGPYAGRGLGATVWDPINNKAYVDTSRGFWELDPSNTTQTSVGTWTQLSTSTYSGTFPGSSAAHHSACLFEDPNDATRSIMAWAGQNTEIIGWRKLDGSDSYSLHTFSTTGTLDPELYTDSGGQGVEPGIAFHKGTGRLYIHNTDASRSPTVTDTYFLDLSGFDFDSPTSVAWEVETRQSGRTPTLQDHGHVYNKMIGIKDNEAIVYYPEPTQDFFVFSGIIRDMFFGEVEFFPIPVGNPTRDVACKHNRLEHCSADGRMYFAQGDVVSSGFDNKIFSFDLNNFVDGNWRNDISACPPAGEVLPEEFDESGWVYRPSNDTFLGVPGFQLGPTACAGVTSFDKRPAELDRQTMLWADNAWATHPGIASGFGRHGQFDIVNDVYWTFTGGNVFRFNPTTNVWNTFSVAGMAIEDDNYHAIDSAGQKLYGFDSLQSFQIWEFDLSTKAGRAIDLPAEFENIWKETKMHWDSSGDQLIVVAFKQHAEDGASPIKGLWALNPMTDTWSRFTHRVTGTPIDVTGLSSSGAKVTVTAPNHGMSAGNSFYLDGVVNETPKTIEDIVQSGENVIITITGHGYQVGDFVFIGNVVGSGTNAYIWHGLHLIISATSNTFTIRLTGPGSSNTARSAQIGVATAARVSPYNGSYTVDSVTSVDVFTYTASDVPEDASPSSNKVFIYENGQEMQGRTTGFDSDNGILIAGWPEESGHTDVFISRLSFGSGAEPGVASLPDVTQEPINAALLVGGVSPSVIEKIGMPEPFADSKKVYIQKGKPERTI